MLTANILYDLGMGEGFGGGFGTGDGYADYKLSGSDKNGGGGGPSGGGSGGCGPYLTIFIVICVLYFLIKLMAIL